jgi:hypothetical protein
MALSKFFTFLLFSFMLSISLDAAAENNFNTENSGIEIGKDTYKGKRKRNKPSQASRSAFSKQSKHAKRSVKRNDKRNKKMLKHRSKKQKRQGRFSKKDTFR